MHIVLFVIEQTALESFSFTLCTVQQLVSASTLPSTEGVVSDESGQFNEMKDLNSMLGNAQKQMSLFIDRCVCT